MTGEQNLTSSSLSAAEWFGRKRVEELMDDPSLPADQHSRALAGLKRINVVSFVARSLAAPIIAFARQRQLTTVRLLDVACGGGDVAVSLSRIARRHGIALDMTLVDRSETALSQAAELAQRFGMPVKTMKADVTKSLHVRQIDVVTNSLFLHHLDAADVIAVLKHMHQAGSLLLVSDLRRSAAGWAFAWAGCRLLSRSPIVHFDGPASVRGAWTIEEIRQHALAAGLPNPEITPQWPFRMLLRSASV